MRKIQLIVALLGCTLMAAAQKYAGGDISLLPSYEAKGAQYYDTDGQSVANPLEFFHQKGMNAMRVRLFVNPANAPSDAKGQGVCQDLDYVTRLAKQIKDSGMKLMLDFHYSDTWADPAKQWTPDAWKGLDDNALADSLDHYTRKVLQRLKAEGATPDFIQASTSLTLNFQRRPIFAAGILLFSIQASTVSRLTPRYSQISFIEYQRSMVGSIKMSSLSGGFR